jgi:hypothetical protein
MDRERRIPMKRFQIEMAGVLVIFALVAVPGWAGPKHYVASYGLDTNPCSLASPCRSFAQAVSVTDAGGEVIVLDTGGYGSVTITKSISIIAPVGMYASVTPGSGTNGITINAGASDKVLVKGLTIKGTAGSMDGILANTVGTLIVDNCFISGLGSDGIQFNAPDSELMILNSKIHDNGVYGVSVSNSSTWIYVSVNNVEITNNAGGFVIWPDGTGSVSATVTNSLVNNNSGYGFYNGGASSGISVLNLEHCIVSGGEVGIYTYNNSASDVTRLSNCTVTGNTTGICQAPGTSGTIWSRQNNMVAGNGTDSNISPTPLSAW